MTQPRQRVLIVCDDFEREERYEEWLQPHATPIGCVFASEAPALAEREQPDIAIVDLRLEDCTPAEYLKLRADAKALQIPTLLIVAATDSLTEECASNSTRARQESVLVLATPYERSAFESAVLALLGMRSSDAF